MRMSSVTMKRFFQFTIEKASQHSSNTTEEQKPIRVKKLLVAIVPVLCN